MADAYTNQQLEDYLKETRMRNDLLREGIHKTDNLSTAVKLMTVAAVALTGAMIATVILQK